LNYTNHFNATFGFKHESEALSLSPHVGSSEHLHISFKYPKISKDKTCIDT